jgi:hypothetical protein
MSKAAILARSTVRNAAGHARAAIVIACAAALILAGQALPF